MSENDIRRAGPGDGAICARIVCDWIDRTPWIAPRLTREQIAGIVEGAMAAREIWLIGGPAEGYVSVNPATGQIGALYCDRTGAGLGRALLDRAKEGREYLQLWTHAPNVDAHRFYAREGFAAVEEKAMGDDGLPEIRMEWRR